MTPRGNHNAAVLALALLLVLEADRPAAGTSMEAQARETAFGQAPT